MQKADERERIGAAPGLQNPIALIVPEIPASRGNRVYYFAVFIPNSTNITDTEPVPASEPASPATESAAPAPRQYGDVAAIYDALMVGVPHGAWLSRIEKEARKRGVSPRSALDCACGTGLVTELLWERGYKPVVGFDLSPQMITIAKTKAASWKATPLRPLPRFQVQNAATLDLGDQTFDLVISLFDSLNYILEPSDLQSAFHRLFHHTSPGGMIAFDMNAPLALETDLFTQSNHFGPVRHDWTAHYDPDTHLCRVDMDFEIDNFEGGEPRYFSEVHVQRAYDPDDVTRWLGQAGFVRIESFGNYGERAPGPKSDRILWVGEKNA